MRVRTKLKLDGYSPKFQEYLMATPEAEPSSVRRNMALGIWLANEIVHGLPPAGPMKGDCSRFDNFRD